MVHTTFESLCRCSKQRFISTVHHGYKFRIIPSWWQDEVVTDYAYNFIVSDAWPGAGAMIIIKGGTLGTVWTAKPLRPMSLQIFFTYGSLRRASLNTGWPHCSWPEEFQGNVKLRLNPQDPRTSSRLVNAELHVLPSTYAARSSSSDFATPCRSPSADYALTTSLRKVHYNEPSRWCSSRIRGLLGLKKPPGQLSQSMCGATRYQQKPHEKSRKSASLIGHWSGH